MQRIRFSFRDATYRAIQRGLRTRLCEQREEWDKRQQNLTEAAFPRIFYKQLANAKIFSGIYYQDPISGQWVENDIVILLDDVLIQIEVKAGIGAIDSPATNFQRHVRVIQNLIIKAYKQTKRFFDYLASADEVALYAHTDNEYIEIQRIRLSDFRLLIPIGLTVESFTPFSTMCKVFPEILPNLGKYPFLSMSIEESLRS